MVMSAKHPNELEQRQPMTEEPVTTYVVSVFEKPFGVQVLTTKGKAKAWADAKEIGDKVRVENSMPKPKRR